MKYPIIRIGQASDPDLDGTSFVGVSRFGDSDKVSIVVPYGVILDDEIEDSNQEQKEQYAFLRRYVKAVQKALSSNLTKERLEEKAGIHNPVAAINLLHDYLSMGKFIEYDSVCELSERGKIDFSQTIKKVRPTIVNKNFYFDTYITRRKTPVGDNFIAAVQCNVINHFMKHGGVILFGQSVSIPTTKVKLDEHIITMLRKELTNTFNSRKENIIRWCISYIEGLRNLNEGEKGGEWKYAIIASTLWEVMIDSVFGNQVVRDKTKYGTTYEFTYIDGRSPKKGNTTQHDTIYEDEESLMIIDAKMYCNQDNLLSEKVLGKQFGYYEQAKLVKESSHEHKNIINILMLPHDDLCGGPYFQNKLIIDPHTKQEEDPYKIIYIFGYPANTLIDDFYYGRKKGEWLIEEFKRMIQDPGMETFLENRGAVYDFKNMPSIQAYDSWPTI